MKNDDNDKAYELQKEFMFIILLLCLIVFIYSFATNINDFDGNVDHIKYIYNIFYVIISFILIILRILFLRKKFSRKDYVIFYIACIINSFFLFY